MENHWQMNKCGSTWQSSSEPAVVSQVQSQDSSRASMINSGHYTYPPIVQESSSSTRKRMADPLFQTTNFNLYNSTLSVMGTPFFTLLSGPSSFTQYDSHQILSSKPSHSSSNGHVYNSSSIVGPTGHESSVGPPKLSSQNIDNRYLKSRIAIPPPVPMRSLAGDGGNTASYLHEQANGFTSLKNVPAQHGKLHSSSVQHQSSLLTSGLPRVFCLYASGDLFLSNSGLLGVVCSCHGIHMSISKFSEHSGLQDVNPGDAVHTDSGETIVQWRKVYFSKIGIRIPEDQCGWNWPAGYSTAADVAKSNEMAPNKTKIADLPNSGGSPSSRPYSGSRKPLILPDHLCSNQNLLQSNAHGGPTNKTIERNVAHLSISKLAARTDYGFKSIPTYSDRINNRRDGDMMEKSKVSSNIELRLGQPSQQNPTLGKLEVPGFSTRACRVGHPQESVSSQRIIYDVAESNRITEESKQLVNCAAQAAKPGSTEGENQLGFGAYSTRTSLQPEQLKGDVVAGLVNSMLFSQFSNPKGKTPKQQYVESRIPKLVDKKKALEHVHHGSPRPVTSRHISSIQPLISKAPPMVLSSIVMTASTSKVEGAGVMNSHTPSSKVSSLCGLEKDRNVSCHPVNGNLWGSINIPFKTAASTCNLPEIATKPGHCVTASWIANDAQKSALISVSQETSFQTGKTGVQSSPYQTAPPLPRIGITEDISSSSGHGNCFQGTSCAYIPENCSCVVQNDHTVDNFNLDERKFLSAFGEPSKIGAPILSTSSFQKGCSLHDESISLGKTGYAIKPSLKKVEFNAFQWKDVPNKTVCRDDMAKSSEDRVNVIDQTSDVVAKSVDQTVEKVDCMKEQVMSNISSKCSAPALTQASVKISNGDSCNDDAQNTDCAKNWSSDGCSNTGFDGFPLTTETQSKSVPDRSTRSLVDELRVIDSLRLKKVQNQIPTCDNSTSFNTFEKEFEYRKRKRETKFKILGKSFPASPVSSISTGTSGQSSQSLEDIHAVDKIQKEFSCKTQKRVYDDFLDIPESSRGKKVRTDWNQESPYRRFTRPVVCGRYGLISNGDTSKPAKIFSLKKIIKASKRCSPVGDEFVKKSLVKTLKKSIIRERNRQTDRFSSYDEDYCHMGRNRQTDRFSSYDEDYCHMGKGVEVYSDDDTVEASDSDFGTKKRRKSKKIRKRSLYDLITKEKDSGFATISKNTDSMSQDNMENGGNSDNLYAVENVSRSPKEVICKSTPEVGKVCNVCGSLNNDEFNCLLECRRCLIKVHQACYGISKVPKNYWYCRPCRENATNMACVLCGYEGGVMTRALHSNSIVRSLLIAWNVVPESQETQINIDAHQIIIREHIKASSVAEHMVNNLSCPVNDKIVTNSVTAGIFDITVKQWVHMVCGLWTPGTRCPNVDTMSAFDVSGACFPKGNVVCSMCKRPGGCCIKCRIMDCATHFHPWCAHQKGLLQSEVEGAENENVGFYGRCELHATEDHYHFNHKTSSQSIQIVSFHEKETCARTEGYKGRKREGFRHDSQQKPSGGDGCMVQQEQVDAWNYINQQLLFKKRIHETPLLVQDVESDFRKEYARYKQSKGWKHLVVYKSGIHALGLYTSLFISQSAMVVEYVGEIVGLRVADRRESEYQLGKQLQYKSACYFFRIDKENIIDATRKGGIARFVNHSCQPNCVAKVITVRGEKKVVFFAERDIYPGEEITYDYHFNNEDEGKKILCSCNSSHCRRYLN